MAGLASSTRKPRTSASPRFRHIAASHRSATKSADARRGAAHGGDFTKLPELLRGPRNGRRHKLATQRSLSTRFWILKRPSTSAALTSVRPEYPMRNGARSFAERWSRFLWMTIGCARSWFWRSQLPRPLRSELLRMTAAKLPGAEPGDGTLFCAAKSALAKVLKAERLTR
jgi:hypothetical protein